MALAADAMLGMANRFKVTINPANRSLGSWAKASGLDVTFEVPTYYSGEDWNYVWSFPGKTKYSTIKLVRSAVAKDTPEVKKWLDETAKEFKNHEVTIALHDAHGLVPVMTWTCVSAFPQKWSIEPFEAGNSKIALETLEISHGGFLTDQKKLP